MSLSDVVENTVIVTSTYYNPNLYRDQTSSDFLRSRLATSLIQRAIDAGYAILVVDGYSSTENSPDEVLKQFEAAGAQLYLAAEAGIGKQRRQVILEAYKLSKPVIAWTEPEKHTFIPELWKTIEPINNGEADMVIPRRTSLSSYPTAQQYAEAFGNLFFKQLTGHDLDLWFGPRVWHRDITNVFLDYTGTYGDLWDSLHLPVLQAILEGKRVKSVDINYTHPPEQKQLEEHNVSYTKKRLAQMNNLIPAFDELWKKHQHH